MAKSELMRVVKETKSLLEKNREWKDRYTGYAQKISDNIDVIKTVRSSFREWSPLKVYLNITAAKTAKNTVSFELRYMGQTVAKLKGTRYKKHKLTTKGYDGINKRDFDCDTALSNEDWRGEDAKKFRNALKKRRSPRNTGKQRSNEEHRLESLLLTEFSKRKNKVLRHIKPVTLGTVRFPMPTPISASNHAVLKYSRQYGGGINILTRTGIGGKATRLCVMELKDENTEKEPPKDAMKQAVAYTTFIRELLRSNAGAAWWKLFGFSGNIPDTLELYAACVMPSCPNNNDYSFGDMELSIDTDTIKLHYLYFQEEENRIKINPADTTLATIE